MLARIVLLVFVFAWPRLRMDCNSSLTCKHLCAYACARVCVWVQTTARRQSYRPGREKHILCTHSFFGSTVLFFISPFVPPTSATELGPRVATLGLPSNVIKPKKLTSSQYVAYDHSNCDHIIKCVLTLCYRNNLVLKLKLLSSNFIKQKTPQIIAICSI